MRTLYLECNMGAAGDMIMGALLDLLPEEKAAAFMDKMNHLGLDGVQLHCSRTEKCGITGNLMNVKVHGIGEEALCMESHTPAKMQTHESFDHGNSHAEGGHAQEHLHSHDEMHAQEHLHSHDEMHAHKHPHSHAEPHIHELPINHEISTLHMEFHAEEHQGHTHTHSGMADILALISSLHVSERVKQDAAEVYQLIAEAEAAVHGRPMDQIHFHEVGTMDAVADIVGVCLLMEMLAPEHIAASPVHVGCGQVHCAHGILPVPAPATARILQGIPIYGGQSLEAGRVPIQGELCTPTGAALLKHFAASFTGMPQMQIDQIGYGMGHKDLEAANCIRAFWGTGSQTDRAANQKIAELDCNLDDMTGEAIAYAKEVLCANGALDVFTVPIQMKKNRPGNLLVCLCTVEAADKMASLILKHTKTFGVRKKICDRYCMKTEIQPIQTSYGVVHQKTGVGYGTTKSKLEYEDLRLLAEHYGRSLQEITEEVRKEVTSYKGDRSNKHA